MNEYENMHIQIQIQIHRIYVYLWEVIIIVIIHSFSFLQRLVLIPNSKSQLLVYPGGCWLVHRAILFTHTQVKSGQGDMMTSYAGCAMQWHTRLYIIVSTLRSVVSMYVHCTYTYCKIQRRSANKKYLEVVKASCTFAPKLRHVSAHISYLRLLYLLYTVQSVL